MKKKKLLVLSSTYPRWDDDWEPAFVHELSKRLTDEFDVSVLCPREKGSKSKEIKDQVFIHRYRYAPDLLSTLVSNGGIASNLKSRPLKWLLVPLFFLFQTLAILTAIKRDKPDVIHCHWIIPQGICLYIAKWISGSKIPHLLTSHGGDLYTFQGKVLSKLKRRVINNANSMTVVSQAMTHEVNRIMMREVDACVIPMGIDTENLFYPDDNIERTKSGILFVGRLVDKKGVKYLLEAFPEVLKSHSDATLTIIGDGPEKSNLEELSKSLEIHKKVNFLGSVLNKDLPNFYRKTSLFTAPFITSDNGDQEGLGLVIIEAICCGCNILVGGNNALSDITDVLVNQSRITTASPTNTQSLSESIKNSLTRDAGELKNEIGIINKFGWSNIKKLFSNEINEVIN